MLRLATVFVFASFVAAPVTAGLPPEIMVEDGREYRLTKPGQNAVTLAPTEFGQMVVLRDGAPVATLRCPSGAVSGVAHNPALGRPDGRFRAFCRKS